MKQIETDNSKIYKKYDSNKKLLKNMKLLKIIVAF